MSLKDNDEGKASWCAECHETHLVVHFTEMERSPKTEISAVRWGVAKGWASLPSGGESTDKNLVTRWALGRRLWILRNGQSVKIFISDINIHWGCGDIPVFRGVGDPSYGYQLISFFNQPSACSLDPCQRGNAF